MTIYKTYSELIKMPTFEERFDYLSLNGIVGETTFGGHRYLNQMLYQTDGRWKRVRQEAILRDNGCDLAHENYPISGPVYIHHINPITIEDILNERSCVFDLDNLICVSFGTHNALHYSNKDLLPRNFIMRTKNDTCPWR